MWQARLSVGRGTAGGGKKGGPADAAKGGLEALTAGKDKVIAGSLKTKGVISELIPPAAPAAVHRKT